MDILLEENTLKFCFFVYGKFDIKNPYHRPIKELDAVCLEITNDSEHPIINKYTMDKTFLERIGESEDNREYQSLTSLIRFYDRMRTKCMLSLGEKLMKNWSSHFFVFYKSYSSPHLFEIMQYRMFVQYLSYVPWHFPINVYHIQQFLGCTHSKLTIDDLNITNLRSLLEMPIMIQDIWLSLLECLTSWEDRSINRDLKISPLLFCQMSNEAKLNFVRT